MVERFSYRRLLLFVVVTLFSLASCVSRSRTTISTHSAPYTDEYTVDDYEARGISDRDSGTSLPAHISHFARTPLKPEETEELLAEVGGNWLYGQGIGETALAVGSVVLFPPAAFWFLGNGALALSGYEPVGVSTLLPNEQARKWSESYDAVLSTPGRVVAAVAGEDFRTKETIQEKMRKYLEPDISAE